MLIFNESYLNIFEHSLEGIFQSLSIVISRNQYYLRWLACNLGVSCDECEIKPDIDCMRHALLVGFGSISV